MSFLAFILIVFSAVLHASWNLVAKRSKMTVSFYTLICSVACLCWCHVQFWTPVNVLALPGKFYIFLVGSVLSDIIYCSGLVRAYRTMEMSTAYPMMRSLPILLTAAVTTIGGFGNRLSALAMLGMVVVFTGCMMIPLTDFRSFKFKDYFNSKWFYILLVACGTTGYTIFDKQAQEVLNHCQQYSALSKPMLSLTFYSTRVILLCSSLMLVVLLLPGELNNFKEIIRTKKRFVLMAGFFASMTYTTVLIAMNYVDNVSYVQVFRQLGLIFGRAGGIFILKERFTFPKLIGVVLILSGLALTVLKY